MTWRTLYMAGLLSLCAVASTAQEARAQNTLAELTVGVGSRNWRGEIGETLQRGFGFEVEQELYLTRKAAEARRNNRRLWNVGMGIKLGVFSFVAQPPESTQSIPFNGDLQSYHVQCGPRLRRRIWRGLFVKGGVDYMRMGIGGSALVKEVGLERSWHGVAGSLRAGYDLEPLVLELEGTYHIVPRLGGNLSGVLIRVGIMGF